MAQGIWIWRIFRNCLPLPRRGRRCRRECGPHFSFALPKEKPPPQRWKRKALIQACTSVQTWGNVFCENCCAGEELPAKSRAVCGTYPTRYAATIEHQPSGCKEDTPAPLSAAADTHLRNQPACSEAGSAKREAGQVRYCSPVNAMLPNAGTQFFEEYLSAQPAGGRRACMAVRGGGPLVLGDLTQKCQIIPQRLFF